MISSMILGVLLSFIFIISAVADDGGPMNVQAGGEFQESYVPEHLQGSIELMESTDAAISMGSGESAEEALPSTVHLDSSIAWGIERRSWSQTVRSIVKARFSEFHQASDANFFCPGYSKATREEQENCFVALVAAITKFECNFRPELSFKEPSGRYSVGLLMLSPGECANAPTKEKLKNPIQNLICGTNKMANLISRDNIISGTKGSYGAAAYWSTLRKPYRSGKYKLGKKNLIQQITRNFRSPQQLQAELDFLEGSGYIEPHGSFGEKEE